MSVNIEARDSSFTAGSRGLTNNSRSRVNNSDSISSSSFASQEVLPFGNYFSFLTYVFLHRWYSPESTGQQAEVIPPLTDPISTTRVLCSALILPTMATITGNLFFRSVQSNIQRTILVSCNCFKLTERKLSSTLMWMLRLV